MFDIVFLKLEKKKQKKINFHFFDIVVEAIV